MKIQTEIAPGRELADAVQKGRLEWAAIAEPLLDDPHLVEVQRIATITPAYVIRRGHPLRQAHPIMMNDLRSFPIATGAEESSHLWPNPPDYSGAAITPSIRCDDFAILRQATLNSDLNWLAETSLVSEDEGLAVVSAVDDSSRPVPIVLIHAKRRTPSPAARRAADLLRDALTNKA